MTCSDSQGRFVYQYLTLVLTIAFNIFFGRKQSRGTVISFKSVIDYSPRTISFLCRQIRKLPSLEDVGRLNQYSLALMKLDSRFCLRFHHTCLVTIHFIMSGRLKR